MHTTFWRLGPNCWITKAKLRETLYSMLKQKARSGSDGICFSACACTIFILTRAGTSVRCFNIALMLPTTQQGPTNSTHANPCTVNQRIHLWSQLIFPSSYFLQLLSFFSNLGFNWSCFSSPTCSIPSLHVRKWIEDRYY